MVCFHFSLFVSENNFFLASNGLTDKHLPTYEAMYNQNQTTKSLNLQNPIQRSSTPDSG
jgi:hypothetical protein